jgi:hypothetical protein
VPFKAPDVTINDLKYVPQAVPADVVINGEKYVPADYGNPDVHINGMLYSPLYQWRPIETAPQAGQWVLMWWPDADPSGRHPGTSVCRAGVAYGESHHPRSVGLTPGTGGRGRGCLTDRSLAPPRPPVSTEHRRCVMEELGKKQGGGEDL